MSNMSYCRFGNTAHDFVDCLYALEEADSFNDMNLSDEERQAMDRLAAHARRYIDRYTELQELAEYEFARNMESSNG